MDYLETGITKLPCVWVIYTCVFTDLSHPSTLFKAPATDIRYFARSSSLRV